MEIGGFSVTKTTYKVTGTTAYQGHRPGEEFTADLSEDEERRALERGSIAVAKGRSSKKQDKEEGSDA
jgi:hypothetical protein